MDIAAACVVYPLLSITSGFLLRVHVLRACVWEKCYKSRAGRTLLHSAVRKTLKSRATATRNSKTLCCQWFLKLSVAFALANLFEKCEPFTCLRQNSEPFTSLCPKVRTLPRSGRCVRSYAKTSNPFSQNCTKSTPPHDRPKSCIFTSNFNTDL